MIEVRRTGEGDPLKFEVVVRVGQGESRHHVTMARETCDRLTAGKHTPERCLEAAFRFLLDREPKEAILSRFDVTVISRYFPGRLCAGLAHATPDNGPKARTALRWGRAASSSLGYRRRRNGTLHPV